MTYLDNNATTQPLPEVVAAMAESLLNGWGNPSSIHARGGEAKQRLNKARAQVADLIGASPAEIVFTSGATESNHTAILGALAAQSGKQHIVASSIEHPSSLQLLDYLRGLGYSITLIGVDSHGAIDISRIAAAINAQTALVSLMWANNETGVVHPVAEVAGIARSRGVLFHTDAVQAVGKVVVDLKQMPADLLSMSAHKLHGPTGVGALYVRKGVTLPPLMHGHQERRRRGGTENLSGIVGFGVAAEVLASSWQEHAARMTTLRGRFETALLRLLPQAHINASAAPRLCNTSNFRIDPAIDAELILDRLDKAGVQASSGSACTAAGTEPSHVLTAMGQSADEALAAVRLSFGRDNTMDDVDRVLALLPAIVAPTPGSLAIAA